MNRTLIALTLALTAMGSLLAQPFGPMQEITSDFAGALRVAAGDLDGDGDQDIVATGNEADTILWWENADGAGGSWQSNVVDRGYERPFGVQIVDVDGDRRLDILVGSGGAEHLTYWSSTDRQVWSAHPIPGTLGITFAGYAADMDGDRDLDLVGAGRDLCWWERDPQAPGGWRGFVIDGDYMGSSAMAADIDGDGDMDVVGADYGAGSSQSDTDLLWYPQNERWGMNWSDLYEDFNPGPDVPRPTWPQRPVMQIFRRATCAVAVDMDGDRDLDVLAGSEHMDDVSWFENTEGDGSAWTEHVIDDDYPDCQWVEAADMNRDGVPEVLAAGPGASSVNVYTCQGDPRTDGWLVAELTGPFTGPVCVIAADVDGDRDPDVIAAAKDSGTVAWWENQWQPTISQSAQRLRGLTIRRTVDAFQRAYQGRGGEEAGAALLRQIEGMNQRVTQPIVRAPRGLAVSEPEEMLPAISDLERRRIVPQTTIAPVSPVEMRGRIEVETRDPRIRTQPERSRQPR
jgi:hypothetical protein